MLKPMTPPEHYRGKIPLASTLALLALAACADDSLRHACPKSCHPLLALPELEGGWQAGVGECAMGTPVCDAEGNVLECIGSVTPSPEVCDGLDNDCDRMVDESPEPAPVGHCLNAGVCAGTVPTCEGDRGWVCNYPWTYTGGNPPDGEWCDGRDNDCNGLVDEHFPLQFCYDGPAGTAALGECHPGVLQCRGTHYGETDCVNQQLPSPERCNGLDDDCNGLVDDGLADSVQVGVVMDISGSMSPYLNNLVGALDSLSAGQTGAHTWALWSVGDHASPYWHLVQAMGPFTQFQAALAGLNIEGGNEPTMDVITHACGGWPGWTGQGQRLLLIFGDEPAQGSSQANWGQLPQWCAAAGVQVHVWTPFPAYYQAIADATGGAIHGLTPMDAVAGELEALLPSCAP
jgi:hypothetical protein